VCVVACVCVCERECVRLCVPVFVYIAAEKLDCFVYIGYRAILATDKNKGIRNIFVYVAGVEG